MPLRGKGLPFVTGWPVDKLLKGAGAGADPTEIDVPATPTVVRKTADGTVNNSVVLQNDNHLLLSVGANEVWLVEIFLLAQALSNTPDYKFGWAYPTGCVIYWGSIATGDYNGLTTIGWTDNVTGRSKSALTRESGTLGIASFNGTEGIALRAIIVNGTTAGIANLQWAQNTATVTDTKVLANSCLVAHKLA